VLRTVLLQVDHFCTIHLGGEPFGKRADAPVK